MLGGVEESQRETENLQKAIKTSLNLNVISPWKLSTDVPPNFGFIFRFNLRVLLSFEIIYSKIKYVLNSTKQIEEEKEGIPHE